MEKPKWAAPCLLEFPLVKSISCHKTNCQIQRETERLRKTETDSMSYLLSCLPKVDRFNHETVSNFYCWHRRLSSRRSGNVPPVVSIFDKCHVFVTFAQRRRLIKKQDVQPQIVGTIANEEHTSQPFVWLIYKWHTCRATVREKSHLARISDLMDICRHWYFKSVCFMYVRARRSSTSIRGGGLCARVRVCARTRSL